MPPVIAEDVKGPGVELPQSICDALITGAVNVAFTITVAIIVDVHPFVAVAFIVNVTVVALEFVLVNIPLIAPLPLIGIAEVIPDGLSLVQLMIVPVTDPEISIGAIALPLQTDCVKGEIVTRGCTVIVTVVGVPVQLFADGVIV